MSLTGQNGSYTNSSFGYSSDNSGVTQAQLDVLSQQLTDISYTSAGDFTPVSGNLTVDGLLGIPTYYDVKGYLDSNTTNINSLTLKTNGLSYASGTTSLANNLTLGSGKTLTADNIIVNTNLSIP